jgi:hypothetical protein
MLCCPNHGNVRDVHQLRFHDSIVTCFAAAALGPAQRA